MNTSVEKKPSSSLGWRRLIWNRYALVAALAILGGGTYFAWKELYVRGGGLDQYQIATVQRGSIEDLVTATGTVQPLEYVDVGAQVSGQLKRIHVEVGSVVEVGSLLAEIDPTVYLANVDARRAQLRNQRATLVDRESQLALATLQLTRQQNLMAGDATTADSLQSAEAAVRSAKAQKDALQALIEQTESTLRADEANLNYAKIYAPISGVVVSITARQGQTLNANQQAPTILRIADLTTMTVQTQVSEADVSQLRPDMDVYFTTLGGRGKRWYGTLRKVEPTPTVTNNVVLYNALFDVSNAQRALLPQMTAQVFFVSAMAKDALIVPASAVTLHRGGEGQSRNVDWKSTRENAPASAEGAPTEGRRVGHHIGRNQQTGVSDVPPAIPEKSASEVRKVASADHDHFRSMSREERRAAFERMTPEERETFREKRRAAGERNAEQKQGKTAPRTSTDREANGAIRNTTSEVWAGFMGQRQRSQREAAVKVIDTEGKIEERKVQVGISNRVQVEILSGLNEGEQVVAGIKAQPGAGRVQGQRNTLQTGMQGGQGAGGERGGRAR